MLLLPLYELEWPFGRDGRLVINSGQTVTLNPGDIKDYSRIDVFGTLKINSGSNSGTTNWVVIGCATDFIIHPGGVVDANNHIGLGNLATTTTPDGYGRATGEGVVDGIGQRNGGDGAEGNGGFGSAPGGNHQFGNGGGGASGFASSGQISFSGGDAALTRGGHGGSFDPDRLASNGAPINGNKGGNGSTTYDDGGGGGSRGRHGQNIYIRTKRDFINNGSILMNGQNGGDGGTGANGGSRGGAGGGGAGAGGNGGNLYIRYRRDLITGSINVSRGLGGDGGPGGGSFAGFGGLTGVDGQNGVSGSTNTNSYKTNH